MNRGNQVQIVPDASTTGALIVRGVSAFARRNKGITFSYLFGILILLLAGSGTKLTYDQQREYNRIMNSIDLEAEYLASNDYYSATQAYRATKGWLPWSCDDLCQRNKKRMDRAKDRLDAIRDEGYARMSDAKATAGLFSEVGVGEVKDSFWEYFQAGKQFAKRQSMWDAMFMGIRGIARGRDESMLEYALKVLLQVLLNFSLGLIMALFVFVFGLWSIVKSYQPDPLTAVLFFICAACAAFAFVATYLLAIYGAAAGGVYGLAKMAEANLRLENGQGRRQRVQYNRPHYE